MNNTDAQFDAWLSRTYAMYTKRVRAAAILVQSEARKLISTPSRTVAVKQTRTGKTRKVLGPRGSDRSKPGEPPHRDYGRLRQSVEVFYEAADAGGATLADNPRADVGSRLPYARYLELGTKNMRSRPWLRRTLKENEQRIVSIISTGPV